MIFPMRTTNLLLNLMDERERERERGKSSWKVLQDEMNNETLGGFD